MRSMALKVALSVFPFLSGKKCGRNISTNRVLPARAMEANRPKSRRRSLSVKSRLQNAPIVVRAPRKMGVDSSRRTCSTLPT